MSMIKELPRRGTVALGKRELPPINYRQVDHPICQVLDPDGGHTNIRRMEQEATELATIYCRHSVNPSLQQLDRHVLFYLKQTFPHIQDRYLSVSHPGVRLDYATQLPPSVQKAIVDAFNGRDKGMCATAVSHLSGAAVLRVGVSA